eukprot:1010527-Pyramimonas_sp.AAC.1
MSARRPRTDSMAGLAISEALSVCTRTDYTSSVSFATSLRSGPICCASILGISRISFIRRPSMPLSYFSPPFVINSSSSSSHG